MSGLKPWHQLGRAKKHRISPSGLRPWLVGHRVVEREAIACAERLRTLGSSPPMEVYWMWVRTSVAVMVIVVWVWRVPRLPVMCCPAM